jgi:hypothetical protein
MITGTFDNPEEASASRESLGLCAANAASGCISNKQADTMEQRAMPFMEDNSFNPASKQTDQNQPSTKKGNGCHITTVTRRCNSKI